MDPTNAAPPGELRARVSSLVNDTPTGWSPVVRGYTPAQRWVVRFESGLSAFVKVGATPDTAEWLGAEHSVYAQLSAPFLPRLLGWDGKEPPVLILEDLSAAYWPPPWSPELVRRVLGTLAEVAAYPDPPGLPRLDALRDSQLAGWERVASDPTPFLSLGLCTERWLATSLPALLQAAAGADLSGEALLHSDVRSDNLCVAGERVLLIDWNSACRGNPRVDVAAWLPSLRAEGGPEPWEVVPGEPELAALLAGYFAARAGLPPPQQGSRVREVQLSQLRVALPWAARELSLPPPGPGR